MVGWYPRKTHGVDWVEVCVECEDVAKDRQDNQRGEGECNPDSVCRDIHKEMC